MIDVRVFGGLRVTVTGADLDLGSRRQRVLLAHLVLAAGQGVSHGALVDALWANAPPSTATNQLHRQIGNLRRRLEPGLSPRAAGTLIEAVGDGYRLNTAGVTVDLYQFDDLIRRAESTADPGAGGSADLFRAALDLAAAEPFAGMSDDILGRPEFVALKRRRIEVATRALSTSRSAGRAGEVLPAAYLIAQNAVFDEPLQTELILALAANGRRADALAVFDRVRVALTHELGIDPGNELQAAHLAVLYDDSFVSSRARRPRRPGDGGAPIAQLPPRIVGFVQRPDIDLELRQLANASETGLRVVVFAGMGGIGKTTQAIYWAHSLADRYPDGQLFINLRGFDAADAPLTASAALGSLLASMSIQPSSNPDPAVRAAQLRSAIAGKRMILLLDNAASSQQVRSLLPGTSDVLVIVTSRTQLTGLITRDGARMVALERLSHTSARQLLSARLGSSALSVDQQATDAVLTACSGLPLALSIAASQVAIVRNATLTGLAARLGSERPLQALSDREDDLQSVLASSYRQLSPQAARSFRLFAVHPGTEISRSAVASVTATDRAASDQTVGELIAASIVVDAGSGRLSVHDLLLDYARLLLSDARDVEVAADRLIDHYALSVRNAFGVYGRPPFVELPEPLRSELCPDQPDTVAATREWYARESKGVRWAIGAATRKGRVRLAAAMCLDTRPMSVYDDVSETLAYTTRVLDHASELEPGVVAELERHVGTYLASLGEPQRARQVVMHALELHRGSGDRVAQAWTLRQLAELDGHSNPSASARGYLQEAAALAHSLDRPDLLCTVLCSQAASLTAAGLPGVARPLLVEARDVAVSAGVRFMISYIDANLAETMLEMGEWQAALDLSRTSLMDLTDELDAGVELLLTSITASAAARLGFREVALNACDQWEQLRARLPNFGNNGPRVGTWPEIEHIRLQFGV